MMKYSISEELYFCKKKSEKSDLFNLKVIKDMTQVT